MSSYNLKTIMKDTLISFLILNPIMIVIGNPVPSLVNQNLGDFDIVSYNTRSVTASSLKLKQLYQTSGDESEMEDPSGQQTDHSSNVNWQQCDNSTGFPIMGEVLAFNVNPCVRKNADDKNEPCGFVFGSNYTITVNFKSEIDASNPRSSLIANDPKSESYAYSGQSFVACTYTQCPIKSGEEKLYTYRFRTLLSNFNRLTFNVTESVYGPSIFCAGTDINYLGRK